MVVGKTPARERSRSGGPFSLSPGERAGVRGNQVYPIPPPNHQANGDKDETRMTKPERIPKSECQMNRSKSGLADLGFESSDFCHSSFGFFKCGAISRYQAIRPKPARPSPAGATVPGSAH